MERFINSNWVFVCMTTQVMSPLERIAEEANKPEGDRNPQKVLGFINQYLISIGKSPFSHLDNIASRNVTLGLAKSLGLDNELVRQMQRRLVEIGVFSADLSDPKYTSEVRDEVIDNIVKKVSTPHFLSFYIDPNYNNYAKRSNKR